MTARDDLARVLHDATCADERCDPMTYDYRAADAVIGAGWAPPISSLYNDIQHARAIADGGHALSVRLDTTTHKGWVTHG